MIGVVGWFWIVDSLVGCRLSGCFVDWLVGRFGCPRRRNVTTSMVGLKNGHIL